MSNPIADTADYFVQQKQYQHQHSLQETQYRNTADRPWTRVLNRISFLIPPTHSRTDDDSIYQDRDTFELMTSGKTGDGSTLDEAYSTLTVKENELKLKRPKNEEEEMLPSADDLSRKTRSYHSKEEETSGYFTRPFPERQQAEEATLESYKPITLPEEGRVKDKWDKTMEKLKLIAHMNHPPPTLQPILGPSHTLATYYPPAFHPLFTAFTRDEYGRKLPPILLQCIYATATDSEYVDGTHWVFRIELQYGDVKWTICRNIADFMALHIKLKVKSNLYDPVPDPPNFPNQLSNLLDTAKSTIGLSEGKHIYSTRRSELTNYLRALLLRAPAIASYDICEFLELSAISIVHDMGWKGKEGYLRNRMHHVAKGFLCLARLNRRWTTEWILLRDSYIAFCKDASSGVPTDILLFDSSLKFEVREPRVYLGSYHIKIRNQSREIEIKGTKREVDQWVQSIQKVKNESPWVRHNRFGSFAPIRHNAKVKWFVDAENHFNAVAEAILSAKVEIYIADWWLSPELEMSLALTIDSYKDIPITAYQMTLYYFGHIMRRYDTHAHSLSDFPAEGHDREVFPGQDYSNPRMKDFVDVAQYDKTLVDRTVTPRMPWHDVTLGVVGPIARDVSRHFIQRWNFLKASKSMHRSRVPFLMPKGEFVAARDESKFLGTCKVQLLRSSARWSSDIEREHSVYNAYMECISQAQHYIYIENQFFISTTKEDKLLRNKIAQALVSRIKRAYDNGEKFRVYIVIPLIPAFEGDLASTEASSARNVMHFQYATISRGSSSIVEKLKEYGIDPDQYINWFSLRNYAKLKVPIRTENPFDDLNRVPSSRSYSSSKTSRSSSSPDDRFCYVTEILYIHSKLMIVDDRIVLMGSANINDRSQLGNRDSEVALLVEDTEMVPSFMNGKEFKASKFAHTLRMQLWKEHLGLLNFEKWSELLKGTKEERKQRATEPRNLSRHASLYPTLARSHNNAKDIKEIEADEPVKMLDRASRVYSLYDTFRTHHPVKRHDAAALDPLSDRFYNDIWMRRATGNTMIYRNLFRCVPDDTVHTYDQHRAFIPIDVGHIANPASSEAEICDQLDQVQGHIVLFPKDYLKNENLLSGTIIDSVTPLVIFT
ncbi:hypothetical protein BY458DRAFT_430498 [Sporodiniella umbellata]|nr:hypothetical protein BY458DRAFT_430498 [Sporodiniella umbellata]